MWMVEVGEVPLHQVCREEEEAWAHFWGYLFHSWTATEGWQAELEMCCHFCSLEEVVGEGLICPVGPSPEEGVSRWAGAEEGPTVPVKVREAPPRTTMRGTDSAAGVSG